MHQPNSFLPILPPFFFFVFFFLNVFFSVEAQKNKSAALSTYHSATTCGEKEIKYPFWKFDSSSTTQHYCGYPGFGIHCSPSNESIIRLPSGALYDDFYVEDIDYENYSMRLVDIDVTVNRDCPRARRNLTIDQRQAPLYVNSSVDFNMTFYFNCTSVVTLSFTYAIDCLSSGNKTSYLCLVKYETPWYDFCEEKVLAPVKEKQAAVYDGSWYNITYGYVTAMNEGFVLDWRATTECLKCEASGGYCGFNSKSDEFLCFCSDGTIEFQVCKKGKKGSLRLIIIGATLAGIMLLSACFIIWYCRHKQCLNGTILLLYKGKTVDDQNLEAFIKQHGFLTPRRYSYSDIKKMTHSFKEKVGEGGYSDVYKGYLSNGVPVAVKMLKTTKGNGEEFINEVASISRTSHVNVVTLLGFCLEGSKRALMYEFLSNGSLEKFISKECEAHLELERMYEIATGIAQGLEYLHRGCNTRILHFDIKPHNILLDEDFCPKISDFGLAKLCARKDSTVSMLGARGTIGYIAPEVFFRNFGGVSYKSDVYSYGMMVLEMVGGRRNAINGEMSNSSEAYFPRWAYERVMLVEDLKLKDNDMTEDENEIARKMIIVGLWCIQTDPSQRPSMTMVIDMLKGGLEEMELPPKPFFWSAPGSGRMSLVTAVPSLETMKSFTLVSDSAAVSHTLSIET